MLVTKNMIHVSIVGEIIIPDKAVEKLGGDQDKQVDEVNNANMRYWPSRKKK